MFGLQMEGWWTYEFCYKDKIRQLHFEPMGENKLVVSPKAREIQGGGPVCRGRKAGRESSVQDCSAH